MIEAAFLALSLAVPQDAPTAAIDIVVPMKRITPAERAAVPIGPAIGANRETWIEMAVADGADGARTATFSSHGVRCALTLRWQEDGGTAQWSADVDGDGELAVGETHEIGVIVSAGAARPHRRAQFRVPTPMRIGDRDHHVQVRRLESGAFVATITGAVDHWIGTADFESAPHRLWILDVDDDGVPGSHGDVFTFLPEHVHLAVPRLDQDSGPVFEAFEAAILGDRRVELRGADADGAMRLVVRAATEPVATYLRRRHERVTATWRRSIATTDLERGESLYERGERELAAAPPAWDFTLDLDAALERARAAGKPAFVLFEEDFNERGKFLDLYTWCDAEVVELLRGFHPIRINRGLDLTHAETRYGITKGPGYAFVATDGRVLQFTDRKSREPVAHAKNFRPPEEMAALLRESLARIAAEAFEPPDRDR